MPAFAYILRCNDTELYYGSTTDLRRRLKDHQRGKVRSTAWRRPVEIVWFQEYETITEARQRERSLKNGRTRRKMIDQLIADFPRELLEPFV